MSAGDRGNAVRTPSPEPRNRVRPEELTAQEVHRLAMLERRNWRRNQEFAGIIPANLFGVFNQSGVNSQNNNNNLNQLFGAMNLHNNNGNPPQQ